MTGELWAYVREVDLLHRDEVEGAPNARSAEWARAVQLNEHLTASFGDGSTVLSVDEDTPALGEIWIAPPHTILRHGLMIKLSSFGRLVTWSPTAFDAWDEAEKRERVDRSDVDRVEAALAHLRYVVVDDVELSEAVYDGVSDMFLTVKQRLGSRNPSWLDRFFLHL